VRLFVAMDVPEETRRALRGLIGQFALICRGARWVNAEGLHVTLKFIGHVDDALLPKIKEALSGVERERPISIAFREFGFFPNERRPRVLFVGIQADKELEPLAKEVEERLVPLGIAKEERAFRPHLTLARFKTNEGLAELRKKIASIASQDFGGSAVKEFYLYQSVLKSSGAVYTKLSTHSFVK
jgi:RNA 2',3'-cyclic 3'-phosphodiesterase